MRSASHRESWVQHPRFPEQALLLESHDGFLAALEQFQERLESVAKGTGLKTRQVKRFANRLESEFRDFQWTMNCHERYEENKLYPYLDQRFGSNCKQLGEQHTDLHELGEQCEQALEKAARGFDETGSLDLEAAQAIVRDFAVRLEGHLENEERLIIPLLLSMTPEEFRSYSSGESESCAVPDDQAL